MPTSTPRRPWQSSMIVPMWSLGEMIVALTMGSYTRAILPSGKSSGW